jgi:hypothetical protein
MRFQGSEERRVLWSRLMTEDLDKGLVMKPRARAMMMESVDDARLGRFVSEV